MFESLSVLMLSLSAAFMIFLWRLNKSAQQDAKDAQDAAPPTPES